MSHSSFDDIFETDDQPRRRPPRRPNRMRGVLPILLVLLVVAGLGFGGYQGYRWVSSNISIGKGGDDFEGDGTGEQIIQVKPGDSGTDIAQTLVDKGVIKSPDRFVALFSNDPEASTITAGSYRLKKGMSSAAALEALLDPANRAGVRVTIPEGSPNAVVFERLSEATGIPVADFEEAAKDYRALGVPENPAKSAEGYLWPGTYDIDEEDDAKAILTMMVDQMKSTLTEKGVPESEWHRTLTIASIVEREARHDEDFGKVVRTIENRLAGKGEANGTPMKLQVDSTVAYAVGDTRTGYSTTPEERQIDSPYNTYKHEGLPIGPISNPGAKSIDATLNPPPGDWLFWVTVNTDTGETKFATTHAEHEKYVKEWREWARTK